MDFTVQIPDFAKAVAEARHDAEAAITGAMREATNGLRSDLRNEIVRAGMGTRLANTWRCNSYPEGRNSLSPAGYVYSNAGMIIDAFSKGATIRPINGAKYLWIPTVNVPRARRRADRSGRTIRGGRMTPEEVENRYNDDLIIRPGRNGGLLAFINVVAAKNGRGFRGRTKGRMAQGRQATPVLMFVLRRTVRLPKLLSPDVLAEKWIGRVPGLVTSRWR